MSFRKIAGTPFRHAGFRSPSATVEKRPDGSLLLCSGLPLPSHPRCTTDWLEHWAEVRPDSPLIAERRGGSDWEVINCSEACFAIRALASQLLKAGASVQRPLAVLSENSTEQALLTWAALYAGVPIAPISPAYSQLGGDYSRLRAAVDLVDPFLFFVQDAARFSEALKVLGIPAERVLAVNNAGATMFQFDSWRRTAPDGSISALHGRLADDLPAKYMFTSGSTGIPKAAVQTRAMLASAQEISASIFEKEPETPPVYLEWLPWHHVMGGNIVLNRVLRFGGTLYIDGGRPVSGRFDQTLTNLREVAPTYYFNVPAGLAMLVAALEIDDACARHFFSRLNYVCYGGAMLSRDVYDRFQSVAERITGERIVLTSVFGATETSGPAISQYWAVDGVGGIGLPLAGLDLKLIEYPSQPGRYELRLRGPNVMRRYLKSPDQTAKAIDAEGFYCLGDEVSFVDPKNPLAGLRFAGRFADDFKLSNGTWVRTAEVRVRLLNACQLVQEVVILHDGGDRLGAFAWLDRVRCRKLFPDLEQIPIHEVRHYPGLLKELAKQLATFNGTHTATSMRVERMLILSEAPSMQHYEITDKGSINRRAVIERRGADAAELFQTPAQAHVVVAERAGERL
jgi:feruloyl-CoA synthase